ncbi:MAG: MoxR family ATPase [Oscillospiraceae bacterium]|nr:MoxR family ATPase [Oscillospiraceae bacterium]
MVKQLSERIQNEVSKVVSGKEKQVRLLIAAVLSEGHILLDDLPGVGKTTLVKALSMALGCDYKRVQFTPDLLPSDIIGMNIFDRQTGAFKRIEGPVRTNLLLADELNRAIPRTQSALLEAMEERQVTIDGETSPLPEPFVVLATQNPVESESTFRLPAAQMDRFMFKLSLGYPKTAEEVYMIKNVGDYIPFDTIEAVTDASELAKLQKDVREVAVSDDVTEYIVKLVSSTRSHPAVKLGASPRASKAMFKAAKALAAIYGRDFATPDDIHELAVPLLSHRLTIDPRARSAGKTPENVLAEIMGQVVVPPEKERLFDEK